MSVLTSGTLAMTRPMDVAREINHYFGERVAIEYVAREPGRIVIDFKVS